MKKKTKIVTMAGIAIVLCSVFLVASPAIAAEQTSQEVSASTITTSSEDDCVLGIYGNANEDDTIDMRDLTYVKLIFFGKKPETELADAKYDGKINPLDFIQIKLIIVGKEKELTIIDTEESIVTVKKPLKRIVAFTQVLELLRSIGIEKDRIVGVESEILGSEVYETFLPEFQKVPGVGSLLNYPDCEAIMNLHPDVVLFLADPWGKGTDEAQVVLESAGIPVIRLRGCVWIRGKKVTDETKKIAYIFDKREEAKEFCDWYGHITDLIKERVEKIPEEDKPKVYLESGWGTYMTIAGDKYQDIEDASGKNIFEEMESSGSVDPEAVVVRDPDVIVKAASMGADGYHLDADDIARMEKVREEIMSRQELQNVKAVKTGRVYVISGHFLSWGLGGCRGFVGTMYMAKWFHPDLFEDLDPKAIHQEYLTRFQRLDIDLDEKGVFVYPEPS